jgi:ABC-2 type transport system permease protein
MFSSTALFPKENFPPWMQVISDLNPVSYSSTFGREIIISGNSIPANWNYFFFLAVFALAMLIIGMLFATKTLKIE